jgi:hypothetical protein
MSNNSNPLFIDVTATTRGKLVAVLMQKFGDVEQEGYEHTLTELEYIKKQIESDGQTGVRIN